MQHSPILRWKISSLPGNRRRPAEPIRGATAGEAVAVEAVALEAVALEAVAAAAAAGGVGVAE